MDSKRRDDWGITLGEVCEDDGFYSSYITTTNEESGSYTDWIHIRGGSKEKVIEATESVLKILGDDFKLDEPLRIIEPREEKDDA